MLGSSKACPMENCTGVKNSVQQFMNIVLGKLPSVVDPVAESLKAASDVNRRRLAGEARVNGWGQECGQTW